MIFFVANLSDQQGVRHTAEPLRAEGETLDASEQQAQCWIKRDGHSRGDEHGQGLGVGQGLEHAPFLRFQGQHGQEGDGDNEQGEEGWPCHLFHGSDHDGAIIAAPAAAFPQFQLFMSLLDHHDGSVDQLAEGDRHSGQRHDVGADA